MIDQTRRRLKTNLGRGWFKRGVRAVVEVAEQWEATNLLGAITEHGETIFYQSESNFTSEVTIHFFRALQEELGEELILVLDNAPYFASKKVRTFAESTDIELCFLPRYSPQLNPVEECWRQLSIQLNNRLFDDIDQMNREIRDALNQIKSPNIYNYLFP